jgi:hypothetical protein
MLRLRFSNMRSFIPLFVLVCYCIRANAQKPRTQSDHNVRRSNIQSDQEQQRLPSSDITLVNHMTQLQSYSTVSRNDVMTNNKENEEERDLQIDIGTVLNIVDTACDLVGNLMLLEGTAVCDCTLTLSLEFGCDFVTDVCAGNFCSTPNVKGAFDLLQTRVTFTYCSNNGTLSDFALPNFCVSVSGNLVRPGATSSAKESTVNGETSISEDRARLFGKGNILDKVQFLDTISVTVDGKACRSASICDSGQGYTFDCSNINSLLKQSTCTPIKTITNLRQEPGSVTFLPQLDDPPIPSIPSMFSFFKNFRSAFQFIQHP